MTYCEQTSDFPNLKDKVLFNRISRVVGITHVEEALIP